MKPDKFLDDFIKIAKKVKGDNFLETHKREDGKMVSVDGDEGISLSGNEPIDREDLGLVLQQMEKNADYKLPNETQKWNKEILKRLYDTHDWLDPDNYYLRWKSDFDGNKGFGVGCIVLSKEDKAVSVPVVIKDFRMQPLDIFYSLEEEKMYPLTKRTIESAFYDTGIADKMVEKRKRNRSPIKDVFPPRLGKYVFASADENMLDKIDITKEDMADFHARVKGKEVLAEAKENETFKKLANKVLNKETIEEGETFKPITKISAAVISPEEKKGYKLDWIEDGDHRQKTASYIDTLEFIKEAFNRDKEYVDDLVDEVDEGNRVAAFRKGDKKSAALDDDELDKALNVKDINTSSRVTTKTKTGEDVTGFVIPKVYSLHTGKITEDKLFIDDDRNIISYTPKVIGKPNPGKRKMREILARDIVQFPTRDTVVSFVWWSRRFNEFVGIQPGKILDHEEIDGVGKAFTLLTTFGSMQKVMKMKNLIKPDFTGNNKYNAILIPDNASLLMFESDSKNLVDNVEEFKKKVTKEASVIEANYFKRTNEFKIKGDDFEKTASPRKTLTELVSKGIPFDKADNLIKQASQNKSSKLYISKPEIEKTASPKEKEAQLEEIVNDLRDIKEEFDLVKTAAEIDDLETADKVLSLNFVNKKNLNYFYRMLPEFQKVVTQLAELLLAARLANIGIPERSIKDSMNSIQNLIEKMEGFQTGER